jgi:hypothetical protein
MNILKHPIYKAIYDLCLEIEKLPASEQATKLVTMASALEQPADMLYSQIAHDHACHCGTELEPHSTGEGRCVRRIVASPEKLQNDFWRVDGQEITGYSMREQRGFYQHPCGCWSRWPGSKNSIEA